MARQTTEKRSRRAATPRTAGQVEAVAAAGLPVPKHGSIRAEWRAMGPLSKIMTMLGLFGFLVGIPGWMTSEYWMGKNPAAFLVPPAIAEQLKPEQVAQLTEALTSLQQHGVRGASEDDVAKALEAASAGNLKLAEGLLEAAYRKSASEVAGAQAGQAKAARHLAALSVVGDANKAITLYRQATQLEPSSREGWIGLGDAAMVAGTLDEAEAAFRHFLTLVPAATDPFNHGSGLDRLGDALMLKGDAAGARALYEEAIGLSRELAASQPNNAQYARNVAVGILKLGDVDAAAGRYAEALETYKDGLRLAEKLTKVDNAQAQSFRDLEIFYKRAGDMEFRLNNAEGTLAAYGDALEIARSLSAKYPDDVSLLRDVAVAENDVGRVLAATGKPQEALGAFSKSLEIRQKLTRIDPANSEWQRDLSVCLLATGDAQLATGATDQASASYEQSLTIMSKLAELDPSNLSLQRDLTAVLKSFGDGKLAAGQKDEAAAAYRRSFETVQKLALVQPDNADLQRDLVIGHVKLADAGEEPAAHLEAALAQVKSMQSQGTLGPIDQWMQADLEKRLETLKTQ